VVHNHTLRLKSMRHILWSRVLVDLVGLVYYIYISYIYYPFIVVF